MSGRVTLKRCLTSLSGLAALGIGACATIGPTHRVPTAADSLFALSLLNEALVEHTRHVVEYDAQKRLALGIRLDRLPNAYAGTRRAEARYARRVQSALENIAFDVLPQDEYLSLRAVHWELETEAEAAVYTSLDFSAVIPGASPLPAIARALALHPIEELKDVERYLYLLDNLGLFISELRSNLAEQAKNGIRIPRVAVDSVVVFLRDYQLPAAVNPFMLAEQRLTQVDSASRLRLAATIAEKIEKSINPQVDSLIAYLQGPYATAADSARPAVLGLVQYPGGREYYQYLLRRHTTLDVSAGDLLAYGLREVERVTSAMTALRGQLGFAGSDSAFRVKLAADARYRIGDPNEFEARVQSAYSVMRDSLRIRLGITVPDSVRFLRRAPHVFDGTRRVKLREGDGLDPTNRLEYDVEHVRRIPTYLIPALVARELVPGRLTVINSIQRSETIPTLRQLMRFAGAVDGWSEYARGLAGELGLYGDSVVAYGALMLELETSARMVTDLGIHHLGWPHQEAVRYLRDYSVDRSAAESDVMRIALTEPARAVAVKVGSREFGGLRAWVRREQGNQFNDGALQREILRVGVLPLQVLGQHLTWWVWKSK